MQQFAEYGHAIVAMAGVALMGLILSPLAAIRRSALGLPPGSVPEANYDNPAYRWNRAYLNLSETMGYFVSAVVAAMLAGANPHLVNWMASLFLISRIITAVVHVRGIGAPERGIRTISYVMGTLACLILAIAAICAAF